MREVSKTYAESQPRLPISEEEQSGTDARKNRPEGLSDADLKARADTVTEVLRKCMTQPLHPTWSGS